MNNSFTREKTDSEIYSTSLKKERSVMETM